MSDAAAALSLHRRRARARVRRWLKRLPRRGNIRRYPLLKYIAEWTLRRPELWRYRHPQTTRAYYIGGLLTFLPLGGVQLFLAVLACLFLRANIPVAAALQFVSNPLTAAPMYVGSYQLGKLLIGLTGWEPAGWVSGAAVYLTLGGIVAGLVLGLVVDLSVRAMSAHGERKHRQLALLASTQNS